MECACRLCGKVNRKDVEDEERRNRFLEPGHEGSRRLRAGTPGGGLAPSRSVRTTSSPSHKQVTNRSLGKEQDGLPEEVLRREDPTLPQNPFAHLSTPAAPAICTWKPLYTGLRPY